MDTYYDIVKGVIESTGVDYVENDKSVWLDGLDFAVPSRKLAIKINRVSVENNDVTATVPIRERGYHKKMHDTVEKAGWELLSLDDRQLVDPSWSNITKPFILMKIAGTAEHVIYGRDVSITRVEVSADLRYANDFLKRYHFAGHASAQDTFLIRCENPRNGVHVGDVVGVFSLRNVRNKPDMIEIARVAWRPGYQVRYGLSKIIDVIKETHPERHRILSFSDNRMGNGQSYGKAGFRYDGDTSPSLWFINPDDPNDSYSWQVATSWGAKQGVIAKSFEKHGLTVPPNCTNQKAREIIETTLPHRHDGGNGYRSYVDCANKRWLLDYDMSADKK